MKKSIYFIFVSIALSYTLSSCNTGKKMLEKGNYQGAVIRSVEKLKSNPDNKNAKLTLENAYPLAVSSLLDKLESHNAVQYEFINTEAVYTYNDLNSMYESIQSSPAARSVIKNPKKYYSQLGKTKPKAAEEQYRAGMEQLSMQTRENYKQAYYYFNEANRFVNNYKDVAIKIEDAYNLSILNVLTDLKPVHSRLYKLSADVFYNEINNTLRQIEKNEFIRFFTPDQAKKRNMAHMDQYMRINFEDFVVGETHSRERIEKMKSDSVKVSQITLKSGTKMDVYDIVTAEVTINRMEVISKGIINLNITDKSNDHKALVNQNFAGNYIWSSEWGHYNGDQRALTVEQLAICKSKRIPPIPPQQMFVEFTKPIHTQVRSKLLNFYNGY